MKQIRNGTMVPTEALGSQRESHASANCAEGRHPEHLVVTHTRFYIRARPGGSREKRVQYAIRSSGQWRTASTAYNPNCHLAIARFVYLPHTVSPLGSYCDSASDNPPSDAHAGQISRTTRALLFIGSSAETARRENPPASAPAPGAGACESPWPRPAARARA